MLSLKPYLELPVAHDRAKSLRRAIVFILDGIAANVIRQNPQAVARFQEAINSVRIDFDQVRDEETALSLSGKTSGILADYRESCEEYLNAGKQQTRNAITLLTESLVKISSASSESAQRLRDVGVKLEIASRTEDLRALGEQLRECLQTICEEADRQKEAANGSRRALEAASVFAGVAPGCDSVTGLPDVSSCVSAIDAAIAAGRRCLVFALAADNIQKVNAQFGFTAGDEILRSLGQHISTHLHAGDTVFRWRGPCLVALSTSSFPGSVLARNSARSATENLAQRFAVPIQDIVVPVSASWSEMRIVEGTATEDVVRRLNDFAIGRSRSRL